MTILSLTLHHLTTGDTLTFTVRGALSEYGRLILNLPLCGDYILDLRINRLLGYGKGGGLRRKPLAWHLIDINKGWEAWNEVTKHRTSTPARIIRS